MHNKRRYMFVVTGVCSTVLGLVFLIPAALQERYGVATGASILFVAGLILIAMAFGE